MPRNPQSLRLTDSYRRRLLAIGRQVEQDARSAWPTIESFDGTDWPERIARSLTRAQQQAVRASAGYLGAILRSERGRGTVPVIESRRYAGISRDGRPLQEALQSPLIGARAALKDGRGPAVALNIGLSRALRTVGFEAVQAGRDALLDHVSESDDFTGHQRAVAGTCAACMALSGTGGPRFEVHPGCQCVPLPVVAGVAATIALPTGLELFRSKSPEEQEAAVGAEAAALIRDGEADLKDFVSHSKQETQDDFITQRPAAEVVS